MLVMPNQLLNYQKNTDKRTNNNEIGNISDMIVYAHRLDVVGKVLVVRVR